METIERITNNYDQLEINYNTLKEQYADSDRNVARLSREREMLQKTISDLSRQVSRKKGHTILRLCLCYNLHVFGTQVCYLIKEIEESRGAEIVMNRSLGDDGHSASFVGSADVRISGHF